MNIFEKILKISMFRKTAEKINYENQKLYKSEEFKRRVSGHRDCFYDYTDNINILTEEQICQVKSFFNKYNINLDFDFISHCFYFEKTGIWDYKYIPEDIYYCFIDTYYNNYSLASVYDNKCFYRKIFPEIKQPETIVSRLNNFWTDSTGQAVSEKEIENIIQKYDELVIKTATDSCGGKGVFFVKKENIIEDFNNICSNIDTDIVVQKVLKQHKNLNLLNSSSVNTIRLFSMLNKDGSVKIYSSVLRMGINGSRVDNACSGGISCGINPDGRLKSVAYSNEGKKFFVHPSSGVNFDRIIIPSYDKACEAIKKLHISIPHFRLVSWDIAIDEDENPVLIEVNLIFSEVTFHQLNNGPLFGDDTEKILEEVFGKKE